MDAGLDMFVTCQSYIYDFNGYNLGNKKGNHALHT